MVVLLLIVHFTGELIARILGGSYLERITNVYTTVIPNYGFMGYPMILALFGNEMLSRFAVMVLPITIYSFMIGMPKFNPADATTFSERFRKAMNLTLAANLVGIVYGLSGLPYPSLIQEICKMGADCIGPMTMVITGITIGRVGLKDSFRNGRAAVMSGIRSVVLPALLIFGTYLLCRETGLDKTVFICTAIYSVFPAPLNTIIFAENYGLDGSYGASCALISMLASIITVPLWLQIAVNLFETL